MRTMWLVLIVGVTALSMGAHESRAATGPSGQAVDSPAADAPSDPSQTGGFLADDVPCSAVAAYWNGPPQAPGMPQGPELAIVSTDIRPKDARLLLDGRMVGRTRYLDGTPGYLYLEPGSYRLEIHFDGYQTIGVNLVASVGCRYDLKYRMERVPGTPKEQKSATGGKAKPFHRVFGPVESGLVESASLSAHGPDPSLRRDLEPSATRDGPSAPIAGALRLRVSPDDAEVLIDGEFVATGRELARMQGPLVTQPGPHVVDVVAPGYESARRSVNLARGEVVELAIELSLKGEK